LFADQETPLAKIVLSQILAKAVCERINFLFQENRRKELSNTIALFELIQKDFQNSTSDPIPGCSLDYGVQKWLQI
tara:strand:- start:7668 stop:7895 length:228 start_codon:yes stop_codon:yes gene_type:complete